LDDKGKLITFDTVYNEYKALPNKLIANYAPPAGVPSFLKAAKKACFMGHEPEGYMRAVATPAERAGFASHV
jgi:aromatic-amino-acid transaminase